MLTKSLLSTAGVPPGVETGKLAEMPERVLQFGDGRFLRAFVDWMVDVANSRGVFLGKIVIVKNRPDGNSIDILNEQDGLFTVLLRGIKDNRVVEEKRIITAVSRGVNPFTDWQLYLDCAENPDLRFVISNTTETGLKYVEEAYFKDKAQKTFPANLTALLYRRFQIFAGDPQKGLIILPCELLADNGLELKNAVLSFTSAWKLPAGFADWLTNHNYFLNTLVDRIVTGYPAGEEIEKKLGYQDSLVVCGEPYHLWAIEGPEFLKNELPLFEAGLNVHWTEDITPFRVRKMRLLNGSHTLLGPVSALLGLKTLRESLNNKTLADFTREAMHKEILPTLALPEEESLLFADSVMERFHNPFNEHYWSDILVNTTAKFSARLQPSLLRFYEDNSSLPPRIVFSLASLAVLYRNDPPEEREVQVFFKDLWSGVDLNSDEDIGELAAQYLGNPDIWGLDLSKLPGLKEKTAGYVRQILDKGIEAALACLR